MAVRKVTSKKTYVATVAIVGLVGLALAQIGKFFGVWAAIDYLYKVDGWVFWAVLLATRAGFAIAWGFSGLAALIFFEQLGWLVFEPGEKSGERERSGRWRGAVIGILGVFMAIALAEVAIRGFAQSPFPYWP